MNQDDFNLEHYLTQAGYSRVQMEKSITGHLHLAARINEIKGAFLLDTGAGATIIEEKRKEKFQMKAEEIEETATGAGASNLPMQSSKENQLNFDSLSLPDFNLILMNLDHVNQAFNNLGLPEVDGVIGADILSECEAIIDYVNLALYLKK